MKNRVVKKGTSDKRAAVMEAFLNLVSERGFHNTPMSLVAKTSGVSTGNIYHYFSSKEDIIIELYRKIKLEFLREMVDGFSEDQTFRERFRSIWLIVLEYRKSHPKETSFLEQFENSPYITPSLSEELMVAAKPLGDLLTQSIKEEIIKNLPIDLLVSLYTGGAVFLAKKCIAGTIVLDDELIESTFDACWDAIKK